MLFRFSLFVLPALLAAGPACAQSADEQLAAASALFDAKRYAAAAQNLEKFFAAYSHHERAGAAALALGRCYTELKQFAKAVSAYERAVATRDAAVTTPALLGLGEAALQSEQYEKAVTALEGAIRAGPRPDQVPAAYFWYGQALAQLGRAADADAAFSRIVRDYPRVDFVDSALLGAALAAMELGEKERARQRLRLLLDRFPQSPERPQGQLAMARLNLQDGRYQEARPVLEALARSTDAVIRNAAEESLVHCLLELKQFPAAAQVLDGILKRLPAADSQRFRVQLTLGHCRYRQEQFEPAAVAYAEAARSTDADVAAEALYWGANARSAQARHPEAAALFAQLVERHAAHALAARAQLRAADELLAAKQIESAAAAYRKVIQLFPRSRQAEEARQGLSALTASLDDPVKLLAALKTAPAAERVPGTLRAARLFLQKRRYADAATTLRGLAPLKPTSLQAAEGRYLLGLAEEGGGRTAAAVAALEEAVRAGTGQPWLVDAHARLAWLHLDQKQPARSETAARAALGLSPAPELARQAQTALLQAQMDQQKWEPALETCSALLASMPDADAVLAVLQAQASIHVRRGRTADALPVWERIVRDYPRTAAAVQAVLDRADHYFEAKDWPAAAEGYRGAAAAAAAGPLRHEARFKYGSTLYHQEKYVEAAAEWDAVAAEKEAGEYGPEALYWAGAACEKAGKSAEAIDRLTRFVTAHPRHARAANAKVRLAALKAVAGGE